MMVLLTFIYLLTYDPAIIGNPRPPPLNTEVEKRIRSIERSILSLKEIQYSLIVMQRSLLSVKNTQELLF